MTIAEAFQGKSLYHSVYNPQGVGIASLENYGGKLTDAGFVFADESRGMWREDGTFPNGDTRWRFVAANQVVEEEGDGL